MAKDRINENREKRHEAFNEIISASGNLSEISYKICKHWCNILNGQFSVLWFRDNIVDEAKEAFKADKNEKAFDPLQIYCKEESYPEYIKNNLTKGLNYRSFAGMALETNQIRSSKNPLGEPKWDKYDNDSNLLNRFPHIICVPLCVQGQQTSSNSALFKIGVLDIYLNNIEDNMQPLEELESLAKLTANVLYNSQKHDLQETIQSINKASLKLFKKDHNSNRAIIITDRYYSEVVTKIGEILHVKHVLLFVKISVSGDSFGCKASYGFKNNKIQMVLEYSQLSEVVKKQNSKIISNIREDMFKPEVIADLIINKTKGKEEIPLLCVPLPAFKGNSKYSGGILFAASKMSPVHKSVQSFSVYDCKMLELIAGTISPVVQLLLENTAVIAGLTHKVIRTFSSIDNEIGTLLEKNSFRDDIQHKLRRLRNSAQDTKMCISGLLNSVGKDNPHEDNLLELIEKETNIFTLLLKAKKVKLQIKFTGKRIDFDLNKITEADWSKIKLAISNVIQNGVDYSYPKTNMTIVLRKKGNCFLIDVTTEGYPINKNEKEVIFEESERGRHATSSEQSGSGMGLPSARKCLIGIGKLELHECKKAKNKCPNRPDPNVVTFRFYLYKDKLER